jgi:hypothetical protein
MRNFRPDYKDYLDPILLAIDGVRPGLMFGCPGYYVGGNLAVCHYNDTLFVKLPADVAARLIARDPAASAQTPMDPRRTMGKHWVFVHVPDLAALKKRVRLLKLAIAFVASQPPKPAPGRPRRAR